MTASTTTKKPTLTAQVADLTNIVHGLVGLVTPLVQGQPATSAPVVEAVGPAAVPAPKVEKAKVEHVLSASDLLKASVEAKGYAFAKGGRTVLNTEALTAAVRVLKTGTPEILPVKASQGRTHLAIGRDGDTVITQYLYVPEA